MDVHRPRPYCPKSMAPRGGWRRFTAMVATIVGLQLVVVGIPAAHGDVAGRQTLTCTPAIAPSAPPPHLIPCTGSPFDGITLSTENDALPSQTPGLEQGRLWAEPWFHEQGICVAWRVEDGLVTTDPLMVTPADVGATWYAIRPGTEAPHPGTGMSEGVWAVENDATGDSSNRNLVLSFSNYPSPGSFVARTVLYAFTPTGMPPNDPNSGNPSWKNPAWCRNTDPGPPGGYYDDPVEASYGTRSTNGYAGDPVNTASGNLVHAEEDLSFPPAAGDLTWARTYNSLDATVGPLGPGWHANLDQRVAEDQATLGVTVFAGDGRQARFVRTGPNVYTRPEELHADLVKLTNGTFELRHDDGHVDAFDANGRLSRRTAWDGQHVDLTYGGAGATLATATSSATGRSLTFTYTSGRLTRVDADDGRSVTYSYTGGDLTSVTAADGGVTHYAVDADHRITAITDPDGKTLLTSTYATDGKVATQTTPSGDTVTFAYVASTRTTTVRHVAASSVTKYVHDPHRRVLSITDARGKVLSKTYDGAGNLASVTDRRGAGVSQTFDAHGNLLSRMEPGGVVVSFTYDSLDRMATSTDGEGNVTTVTYSGANRIPSTVVDGNGRTTTLSVTGGLLTSTADADGVVLTYGYDARRNLTSVTDAAGKVTAYAYDAAGNPLTTTSPLGHVTTFGWDAMRRPTSLADAAGGQVTMTYSAAGRLASRSEATGNPAPNATATTTFAYDSAGRLSSSTDGAGAVSTFGYDADGNLLAVHRPGNLPATTADWTATYDGLGRRLSAVDPTGVTTTFGYDDDGNPTSTTNSAGKTWSRVYDLRGRVTSETDPLSHTTAYTYDHDDRVASITDAGGGVTTFAYDGVGRLTSTTDPTSGVWARTYTPAGRLSTTVDAVSATTSYAYDARGRLATVTDPLSGVATFGYDDDGRLTSSTSAGGLPTSYGYDGAGRVTSVVDPRTGSSSRTFTPRGSVATITDATGGVQRFFYDAVGRLSEATDADLGVAKHFYDGRGNLVRRTDPRGQDETWAWDLADRLLSHTDQLGRSTVQTYDSLGRLATVADPSSRSVVLGYDVADRVASRTYGGGSLVVSYGYDAVGRRTSMTDPSGTSTFGYDLAGRLTSTSQPTSSGVASSSFGYDLAGRRTSMTYPDSSTATFGYDVGGRLTGLSHPSAGSVGYTYDADGRVLTESLPESVSRTYSYASGRLASYTENRGGTAVSTVLGYDLAGRVNAETVGGAAGSFTYDPAGQLKTQTRGGATTTYSYDSAGNRTGEVNGNVSVAYAYDNADQLSSATRTTAGLGTVLDSLSFAHDGAGRLTSVTSVSGVVGSRTLAYDAKGSLQTLTDKRGVALTWTTQRTTNGDGTLVRSSSTAPSLPTPATTTRDFVWDASLPVPQIAVTSTGGASTDCLYGLGRALAIRAGQPDVFSQDAHGSALAVGTAADLAAAPGYDAFGDPSASSPLQPLLDRLTGITSGTDPDQTPRFGYRAELTIDRLTHLRARDYAPSLGAFTTVDPLAGVPATPAATNPYPYAANDPLNKIDPLGLSPRNPCFGSACLLDVNGAFVHTLADFRHQPGRAGAAAVDRYIIQTGSVPSGLDLLNITFNPGYRALDRCSAYSCGSGKALDCALATADLVFTALSIEQAGVGVTRNVVGRTVAETELSGTAPARQLAAEGGSLIEGAPNTAAGLSDDIVRFDPQWASRQLAGQNLPGSSGWATTPGGRTLSVHAAERTFLGGPGRAPIDPGLIDDILGHGTQVVYQGVNDTIRIGAPSLCGRCYVVVDAQNVNHIITVMVPK
jgi:RHS repeat-associated protein